MGLMENEVDALVDLLFSATMRWTSISNARTFLEKTKQIRHAKVGSDLPARRAFGPLIG